MKLEDLIKEIEEETEKQISSKNKEIIANVSKEKKEETKSDTIEETEDKRVFNGREEGSENKLTISKKKAGIEMQKRIIRATRKLLDSQMNLAQGVQYLFKLKKIYIEKENKWVIPKGGKPEIVKDREEIADYLAGEFDGKDDCDYYFLTAEKPDNKALDSLFDRAYGKATQNIKADVGLTMTDFLEKLK